MNPVVQDDLIFISGAYYHVGSVLLRVKPDGGGVEEVWVLAVPQLTNKLRQRKTIRIAGKL